jgi:hypothetical protein
VRRSGTSGATFGGEGVGPGPPGRQGKSAGSLGFTPKVAVGQSRRLRGSQASLVEPRSPVVSDRGLVCYRFGGERVWLPECQ